MVLGIGRTERRKERKRKIKDLAKKRILRFFFGKVKYLISKRE